MPTIEQRLRRIEAMVGMTPARMIVLKGGWNAHDDDIDAFLAGQGIRPTPADLTVYLRTIYERRDGSDDTSVPMQILSVQPLARRPAAAV